MGVIGVPYMQKQAVDSAEYREWEYKDWEANQIP